MTHSKLSRSTPPRFEKVILRGPLCAVWMVAWTLSLGAGSLGVQGAGEATPVQSSAPESASPAIPNPESMTISGGAGEIKGEEPPVRSSTPFEKAEELFHSGQFIDAKIYYQSYVQGSPSGPNAETAYFRLGQIDQQIGSCSTAISFYYLLQNKFPDSAYSHPVRMHLAECQMELGHYAEAEDLFREIVMVDPDKKAQWQAMHYLGLLDEKRFDYANALAKLTRLHVESEDAEIRGKADDLLQEIIDEKLGQTQVVSLIQKFRTGFPVDKLLLKLLSFYRVERDRGNYRATLMEFFRLFPDHPERPRLEKYLKQVDENPSNVLRVGVVVPLTGNLSVTGQRVLQGVQLAVNLQNQKERGKFELVVKNSSAGRPVAQSVEELAADPNMIAIIGPVLSEDVRDSAAVARKYQIPIFSPTASAPGLPELNEFVFRNAMTRDLQGRFLAQYAVNDLGLRRFVILYPTEAYGVELTEVFSNEVRSLGGEIVASVSYDRSQTDFKGQILEIGGMADDDLKKLTQEQIANQTGSKDFGKPGHYSRPLVQMGLWTEGKIDNLKVDLELSYDAIFMPGVYDRVGLIIPQLVFYNIDDVTLLGGSGWNSPELIAIAGKYLKKGYFVDGFFPASEQPEVQTFMQNYKNTFGEDPTILSAQSYDTANIILHLLHSNADNRIKMRTQLNQVRDFPGVSGRTTILPSGEAEKHLFSLSFKKKKIIQVN